MRLSKALMWLAILSVIGGTALELSHSILRSRGFRTEIMVTSSFIVFAFALPASACAETLRRGRLRWLMWTGIISCAVAAAGWIAWIIIRGSTLRWQLDGVEAALGSVSAFCGVCMIAAVTGMHRISSVAGRIVRLGAIVSAAVLAGQVIATLWQPQRWSSNDAASELSVVVGILTLLLTLLTMVLARWRNLAAGDEGEDVVRMDMKFWCPRCGAEQASQTGGALCGRCGLSVRVMVP
jgi:ribosomal protein S27AE